MIGGLGVQTFANFMDVWEQFLVKKRQNTRILSNRVISDPLCKGTCSIVTLVAIGYDRYNKIVKGMAARRISIVEAAVWIVFLWFYSIITCVGPYFGWGHFTLGKFGKKQLKSF